MDINGFWFFILDFFSMKLSGFPVIALDRQLSFNSILNGLTNSKT